MSEVAPARNAVTRSGWASTAPEAAGRAPGRGRRPPGVLVVAGQVRAGARRRARRPSRRAAATMLSRSRRTRDRGRPAPRPGAARHDCAAPRTSAAGARRARPLRRSAAGDRRFGPIGYRPVVLGRRVTRLRAGDGRRPEGVGSVIPRRRRARLAVRVGLTGRQGALPDRLHLGVGGGGDREELVDVLGRIGQRVQGEGQRGSEAHAGLPPDLAAQHALRRFQRGRRFGARLVVAETV